MPRHTVISVGNISLGGTGKSLFCHFLIKLIRNPVVITRGYGARLSLKEPFLVSDGVRIFSTADCVGDEAFMLAYYSQIPVISCLSRKKAVIYLAQLFSYKKYTVILDDAYQNHALKKDCEILLVDGRLDLSTERCFPAGTLREKDVSRATIVIITHASKSIAAYRGRLLAHGLHKQHYLFRGHHVFSHVSDLSGKKISINLLKDKSLFACAGIGSFGQFLKTITDQAGLIVGAYQEYADHYFYRASDIKMLEEKASSIGCFGIITTTKDWVKIKPYVNVSSKNSSIWLVLHVEFEFLTRAEYSSFKKVLSKYRASS